MNVYICPKCGNAVLVPVREEETLECLFPLCGYRVREVDLDDAYALGEEDDESYGEGESQNEADFD